MVTRFSLIFRAACYAMGKPKGPQNSVLPMWHSKFLFFFIVRPGRVKMYRNIKLNYYKNQNNRLTNPIFWQHLVTANSKYMSLPQTNKYKFLAEHNYFSIIKILIKQKCLNSRPK